MDKIEPKTSEIQFLVVMRQARIIGIAIIISLSLILLTGLAVSGSYVNPELYTYNLFTLILCPILCISSYSLKKFMLKKVTIENFKKFYFNAIVLPFALCELGGILCITTSLFINQNILYALAGYAISIFYMYINFPKIEDYKGFT
jgi:hypothetical protein